MFTPETARQFRESSLEVMNFAVAHAHHIGDAGGLNAAQRTSLGELLFALARLQEIFSQVPVAQKVDDKP